MSDDGQTQGVSIDVGSVRLTEMFVTKNPIVFEEQQAILQYVKQKFHENKKHLPKIKFEEVIAVAGTPTTLAAVIQNTSYSDGKVHGYRISAKDLEEGIKKLSVMDLESRKSLAGMDPQRADVIVAGMIILLSALQALKMSSLQVSIRGVRYGAALYAAQEK